MADKFGMMSQAYFKGKRELLEWIRDFLQMEIPKVETLASGAHYCQLLDALHPGTVKMSRVNYGAYLEEHYVQNWKLIQIAFQKCGIQKLIPVQRLVKGRFQDNLEFLQWFHQYFNSSYYARDYDPIEKRKRCKGSNQIKSNSRSAKTKKQRKHSNLTNSPGGGKLIKARTSGKGTASGNDKLKNDIAALTKDKTYLEEQLERISTTAKAIESERDFYFNVLLKVEKMCRETTSPENPDIKKILHILYSSNENTPRTPRSNESDLVQKSVQEEEEDTLVAIDDTLMDRE